MKCNKCGAENQEGAKFCEECGSRLIVETKKRIYCRQCGIENLIESKFCNHCGANLYGSDSNNTQPVQDTPVKQSNIGKKGLIVFIIAVIIGIFGWKYLFGGTSDVIVGKWKATSVMVFGHEVSIEKYNPSYNCVLTMNSDQTFKLDSSESSGSESGTWEKKNDKYYLIDSINVTYEMKLDGSKISLNINGITIFFEKQ